MSTYLFTFRPPSGYAPSAATFFAWPDWQLELSARFKDRGNPGFTAASLGASAAGGAVEVCELASHDDRFVHWHDTMAALHD